MSIRSKFLAKWGENLMRNHDSELALNMFDRAIKADPKELKAYLGKAGIYVGKGNTGEAIKILDQAIAANPEYYPVLYEAKQGIPDYINKSRTNQ